MILPLWGGESLVGAWLEAGDWVTTESQVLHNISINTIITPDSREYIHSISSHLNAMLRRSVRAGYCPSYLQIFVSNKSLLTPPSKEN